MADDETPEKEKEINKRWRRKNSKQGEREFQNEREVTVPNAAKRLPKRKTK